MLVGTRRQCQAEKESLRGSEDCLGDQQAQQGLAILEFGADPRKKAEYTFEKVMDDWKVEYEAAVNAGEKARDVQSRQQAAEQHRSEIKQRLRTRVLPERESDEPFGDPKLFPVVGAPPETPTKVNVSRIIPSWLRKG